MIARVSIRLKPAILDPQGKTIHRSLGQLGYNEVNAVRIGKLIELDIEDADPEKLKMRVEEMSAKLLANPLMEDYEVELLEEVSDEK